MKEKITLILTIILSILLLASLYYGFFIKPKEITYTSYIPTTKSITETSTSFITKTEIETKTTTYSTTKTETSISTYRIIEDEALIEPDKAEPSSAFFGRVGYEEVAIGLRFSVVNVGEYTILIDKSLVIIKGDIISEKKGFSLEFPFYKETESYILTQNNRTALFRIYAYFDPQKIKEEDYGKKHTVELFITYKIVEKNQFKTLNFTYTYELYSWYKDYIEKMKRVGK